MSRGKLQLGCAITLRLLNCQFPENLSQNTLLLQL